MFVGIHTLVWTYLGSSLTTSTRSMTSLSLSPYKFSLIISMKGSSANRLVLDLKVTHTCMYVLFVCVFSRKVSAPRSLFGPGSHAYMYACMHVFAYTKHSRAKKTYSGPQSYVTILQNNIVRYVQDCERYIYIYIYKILQNCEDRKKRILGGRAAANLKKWPENCGENMEGKCKLAQPLMT
jgi:hypothetical protein